MSMRCKSALENVAYNEMAVPAVLGCLQVQAGADLT